VRRVPFLEECFASTTFMENTTLSLISFFFTETQMLFTFWHSYYDIITMCVYSPFFLAHPLHICEFILHWWFDTPRFKHFLNLFNTVLFADGLISAYVCKRMISDECLKMTKRNEVS